MKTASMMDLGPTNGLLASPRNDRRFLRKRASSTRFVEAEEDNDDENEPLVELVGEDAKRMSDKNRSSSNHARHNKYQSLSSIMAGNGGDGRKQSDRISRKTPLRRSPTSVMATLSPSSFSYSHVSSFNSCSNLSSPKCFGNKNYSSPPYNHEYHYPYNRNSNNNHNSLTRSRSFSHVGISMATRSSFSTSLRSISLDHYRMPEEGEDVAYQEGRERDDSISEQHDYDNYDDDYDEPDSDDSKRHVPHAHAPTTKKIVSAFPLHKSIIRIPVVVVLLAVFSWICYILAQLKLDRWNMNNNKRRRQRDHNTHHSDEWIFPRTVFLDATMKYPPRVRVSNLTKAFRHVRSAHLEYPMANDTYLYHHLQNSADYSALAEPLETENCEPRYEWQSSARPNCNAMHELDLSHIYQENAQTGVKRPRVRLIANGYWSDIWTIVETDYDQSAIDGVPGTLPSKKFVAKTLRYQHELNLRNYDRNRRDAMAMERLTSSKSVVDIYGYCTVAELVEYADGGDLDRALIGKRRKDLEEGEDRSQQEYSSVQKLQMATQGAMGLAALHNIDQEGLASLAHTDIGTGQFIFVDGRLKLNDFNRARFILKYKQNETNCPYYVGKNPGKWRSPEEYRYDAQSEKVDVYSFGNILYVLLQQERPFKGVSSDEAMQMVINGTRPTMYEDVWNSPDPITQILIQAMKMCHEHSPNKRASAREVERFLKNAMKKYDPGTLEEWGDV